MKPTEQERRSAAVRGVTPTTDLWGHVAEKRQGLIDAANTRIAELESDVAQWTERAMTAEGYLVAIRDKVLEIANTACDDCPDELILPGGAAR